MQNHLTHFSDEWPWRIPLRNKHKEIVAYALVDEADYELISQFRWCRQPTGYAARLEWHGIGNKQTMTYLHRTVLGLVPGDGKEADHINRDRLDNRRGNLRVCTHAENLQNVPGRSGTSVFRGVSLHRGKWVACVILAGIKYRAGPFTSEDEAARIAVDLLRRMTMPLPDAGLRVMKQA